MYTALLWRVMVRYTVQRAACPGNGFGPHLRSEVGHEVIYIVGKQPFLIIFGQLLLRPGHH